ncbi:MAG: acetyl-CoA carboxylase biotin carboxylase subunit [Candidatus Omnitrophica bacterium]|nr:acetyl-CoA carboxylase biotin carboxylase subunit [Candidatus Omnitrophota bacterium]
MFSRVFVANRGEIALRVIRACQELGLVTIIGFSEADRETLPVKLADEKICIGPPAPGESYLNMPAILSAIDVTKAQAVHPGYGFLSENVPFVEICESSGLKFIGPSSAVIQLMGDKSLARKTVRENRVPVIPGADGVDDFRQALSEVKHIGFPVMIKASGGGGGRGMRVVKNIGEFESAWKMCQEEARIAFDNPSLYLEKYVERPRHVEIQILADRKGKVIVFPERDCSVQRRHQKLIEESPSPIVNPWLRAKLFRHALRIARAVKYESAGTIEFLVDSGRTAYFMEMNTRIQVEHPVTEMVTGIDLVRQQILIAREEKLSLQQYQVQAGGHAIECRINAEDPANNFMPCPGRITRLHLPGGMGVRVDTYLKPGSVISPYYDSLLAKLICFGKSREEAIEKMQRALDEMVIEGVKTTLPLHRKIVRQPLFLNGRYYVGWLEKALAQGLLEK